VRTTLTFNPLPPKEGEEATWGDFEHHRLVKDFRIKATSYCSMKGFIRHRVTLFYLALAFLVWVSPGNAGHDDEYIETVPAERVKAMLDRGEQLVFIDLRPPGDFAKSRLPGARSIPIAEVQKRFAEIPKSGRVILYCGCPPGGLDESYSFLSLRSKGFRNVSVLAEGFDGWLKHRYPVENRHP
jgi:rhodanese-related sulfurtransferase